MKLDVTGRHVNVTPALRTLAREKILKLKKWIDDLMEVHVIFTVEKHRHIAEIVAHGRHVVFSAREVTADMYTSIGKCVDKLESQARKHKEKFEARRRRGAGLAQAAVAAAAPASTRRAARRRLPVTDGRRSILEMEAEEPPRIVKTDTFPRKPMSVEEAALQVRQSDLEFFVFRNERSREVNVLYRRKDGSLGLIEPEG